VKEILANKIILAENRLTKELVIFKTLHKSPAVYKKTKTSLLPINIAYMVCLIKYFETDDCVFLMLEYCTPGTLWDIVKPLVLQTSQMVVIDDDTPIRNLEDHHGECTPAKPQTSIIKASKSFIQDRKISISTCSDSCDNVPDCDNTNNSDDNSNDSFDDISVVHTNNDSMLVVTNDQIEHFDGYVEHDFDDEKMYTPENILLKNSKKMLDSISKSLSKNDIGAKNVLDKLDSIENRVKLHMKGEISPDDGIPPLQSTPITKTIISPCVTPPVFSSPIHDHTIKTDAVVCPAHPRVLRKLSELLPQCPDPELLNSTMLPDRLIRTWSAEIAQVLSSLHYREILVRDLNPSNVLLDSSGHVKLTYQCEWVSVDTELDQNAVNDHFCAPEVVSVGDLTPAADWWSYGALLHLLYCGHSPSSVLATGVDSSIPLGSFPPGLAEEVKQFISDLLQPAPEQRLGAGSRGSHDVRVHPFFHGWNWEQMSWKRN